MSVFGLCFMLVLCCAVPWGVAGQERATQPKGVAEASRLSGQANKLYDEGKYDAAIPLAERALAIYEKALGSDHPQLAVTLDTLAGLYVAKGDYEKAESFYLRALAVFEKALGPDHPELAATLNNLAALYAAKGDYTKAEALYLRDLAITEKALGQDHPDLAATLNNLAALYATKGDYAKAEPLYLRDLAITEKALGPDHPELASTLNNLALLYKTKGDYAKAEPLYLRDLAITEKALGSDHPEVATTLNNLASLYEDKGDDAKAELLYLRSLAINEKALGLDHPEVASTLNNLAGLYKAKGDYAKAEQLYLRSLAINEKALGRDHPGVATILINLAGLYEAKGDYVRAVQFQSRGNEVNERNLALILATGSERQKLAYLATLSGNTYASVSLHARSAPSDPQALRLALTTVLRRKGRALDAMSDQVSSLRRRLDPQDRVLLDQLSATQSQLSALVLGGPGQTPPTEQKVAVSRLEAEVERLQDDVSRRSAEFRVRTQPVAIEQVRQALPPGAALAEFFSYRPFDAKAKAIDERFGPARYVAYVLRKEGEPLWVDLGEAASVDADIARLLAAMKCPQTVDDIRKCPPVAEVKRLARAVDERVMRPVRKLLGETRQVFVSPDGALNLMPFAALVDEGGKYLVESYSLTYLTSGRDLLRLQLGSESRQPPLVVADPSFDAAKSPTAPARVAGGAQARRSGDMQRMIFVSLPGTAAEAKALAGALPGVRVLTQAQATETALKGVSGPRVLHVATHGFFLPDQPREETTAETRGIKLVSGDETTASARVENPLLRSGLALEGANNRQGANGEDGILTALEAAGLDLWGTKLVVLSACETGVGEVKSGEGVYGLRRALVLAGSESQVMSLWQVADDATRDLMVSYYKRLLAGEGRTEALRQVQLEMLAGSSLNAGAQQRGLVLKPGGAEGFRHPYYWAAFIQSGDWRRMNGPTVKKE
jgi:CHAT domain-containing protein/tetratricopeptide (TPR) repeat protein